MIRFHKVVVTQVNWDGNGNDRSFDFWSADLEGLLRRIHAAFNMEHTVVEIDGSVVL